MPPINNPGGSSSGGSGTVTQVNTGNGLTGGPITTTGTIDLANVAAVSHKFVNSVAANVLVQVQPAAADLSDGTTGSGAVVLSVSPALTGSPTAPTQAASDNSTKIATDAYVTTAITNAIAAVNPAIAVLAATTAAGDTSAYTYLNGVGGIGATLTGANNVAFSCDGVSFNTLGQRVLVKNDTQAPSGAFNGVYYVTQVQTAILPPILTRALDYDQPSDMNNTGAIPVVSGTLNGTTSWVQTSTVATVGTDAVTFAKFSINPSSIVTAIGVTTANGVSGSSGGGTTPNLTITLGAITPTSVNGATITTTTGTITLTNGKTLTVSDSTTLATNAITLGGGEVITFSATNALSLLTTGTSVMTFPTATDTVVTLAATQTVTNKRITRRAPTITQSATPTINTDNTDYAEITGLAQDITSMTTNLSGTPVKGDTLWLSITGTAARAITWGTSFEASTVALPTTTVTTVRLDIGFTWNVATSKWRCVAVA